VKRIAGKLDRFRGADRDAHLRRVNAAVQFGEGIAGPGPTLTNYDEWRFVEITNPEPSRMNSGLATT